MDTEIEIVMLKSGQVIVGSVVCDEATGKAISILNPRQIIVVKDGLQLIELFGKPDELILHDTPIYTSNNTDKDMRRAYIQATTSLLVAN